MLHAICNEKTLEPISGDTTVYSLHMSFLVKDSLLCGTDLTHAFKDVADTYIYVLKIEFRTEFNATFYP